MILREVGFIPRRSEEVKEEEMATEKLSNLFKATLLLMAGLDPDTSQAESRNSCYPLHIGGEQVTVTLQ